MPVLALSKATPDRPKQTPWPSWPMEYPSRLRRQAPWISGQGRGVGDATVVGIHAAVSTGRNDGTVGITIGPLRILVHHLAHRREGDVGARPVGQRRWGEDGARAQGGRGGGDFGPVDGVAGTVANRAGRRGVQGDIAVIAANHGGDRSVEIGRA